MAWDGAKCGDARLHEIVPLLSINGRDPNQSAWSLVSTHVPGRSGRECRDRWGLIQDEDAYSGWLSTPATAAVSHADAAEAAAKAHAAAAAKAVAAAEESSGDEDGDASLRCCINGCKAQLLQCNGSKRVGEAVGSAESSHIVCAPCLTQWFAAQTLLLEEGSRRQQRRRCCPVCKSELRAAGAELRANSEQYAMGLLKVASSW